MVPDTWNSSVATCLYYLFSLPELSPPLTASLAHQGGQGSPHHKSRLFCPCGTSRLRTSFSWNTVFLWFSWPNFFLLFAFLDFSSCFVSTSLEEDSSFSSWPVSRVTSSGLCSSHFISFPWITSLKLKWAPIYMLTIRGEKSISPTQISLLSSKPVYPLPTRHLLWLTTRASVSVSTFSDFSLLSSFPSILTSRQVSPI